jgi:hypothetical protein
MEPALSIEDVAKSSGLEVKLNQIDRTPDQLFRYGQSKDGTPSSGTQLFAPGYIFNYMKYLEEKWAQIWDKIRADNDA